MLWGSEGATARPHPHVAKLSENRYFRTSSPQPRHCQVAARHGCCVKQRPVLPGPVPAFRYVAPHRLGQVVAVQGQGQASTGGFRHCLAQGPDTVEGGAAGGGDFSDFPRPEGLLCQGGKIALAGSLHIDPNRARCADGHRHQPARMGQRYRRARFPLRIAHGRFAV